MDLQQITLGSLGVWVIYYTITNNHNRENKYVEIIQSLTDELKVVNDIKEIISRGE